MTFQIAQWIPFLRTHPGRDGSPGIRGVNHRAAIEALKDAGFWILREGVHVVMTDGRRVLTIPCNDPVHSLTMEGIVRDAGLKTEQFRRLL